MSIKVYYNPKCSTCRKAAAILDEKGLNYTTKLYLDDGLTREELVEISEKLKQGPLTFIREKNLKDVGASADGKSDDALIDLLIEYPQLLQRPILVMADRALIGRPAESLHDTL